MSGTYQSRLLYFQGTVSEKCLCFALNYYRKLTRTKTQQDPDKESKNIGRKVFSQYLVL